MPHRYTQPFSKGISGARADLTADAEIIALMAQDLNDLRRECGGVTHDNLIEIGWTKRQVDACFLRAIDAARPTFSDAKPDCVRPVAKRIVRNAQSAHFLDFDAEMRGILSAYLDLDAALPRQARRQWIGMRADPAANEVA